jgi:exosome complex protein LRP1
MDPQTDLPDLVEDLEVNIDELTATLAPLLDTQLSTTASSLPLLDKAKLYVLAAYSIESLLYSTLQASGVNAKEHAIFKELARLKGYFGKIKNVEEHAVAPAQPKSKLDVGAAARFIKHGLAGNEKYDLERAERMAKERARAQLKARQINKKFDDDGQEQSKEATPKKRDIEEVVAEEAQDDEEVLQGLEEPEAQSPVAAAPATKKAKLADPEPMDVDSAPSSQASTNKSRKSKRGKKKSKSTETSDAEEPSQEVSESQEAEPEPETKQRGKTSKSSADEAEQDTPTVTPTRATRSTRSNAAAEASTPTTTEKPKKGRPRKSK